MHIYILLVVCFWLRISKADSFAKSGCYSQSSVSSLLSYKDQFTYQSSGHCEQVCSGKRTIGLLNGKYCYCGNSDPDSGDEVSSSNCDVPCQGYAYENCGGDGYFLIYINSDASNEEVSSSSSSTSTSTSTSSSSTRTTSSSTSSSTTSTSTSSSKTTSSSSSSSPSSSSSTDASSTTDSGSSSSSKARPVTTLISTITASPSGGSQASVIQVTRTANASASGTSSSSSSTSSGGNQNKNSGGSKSLSTGGIVGAVIGSVAGAGILIASVLLFLWHRKRSRNDDDDASDEFTLSGPEKGSHDYQVNGNPFMINNQNNDLAPIDTTSAGAMAAAGMTMNNHGSRSASHRQHPSQGHNSSDNNNSYSSTTGDDMFNFDEHYNQNANAGSANGANSQLPYPLHNDFHRPEDFGRRRLSDGSLPDMIARNPGSLKVVNN